MTIVAERLQSVRASETKAMSQRAATLRASGRSIITLSQGEPDFDTPDAIRFAAIQAICAGQTRYGPVAGVPALREAIRTRLLRDHGVDYPAEQITVGGGAKQVIFNAFLASLNPGDEVVIPAPCWVSYTEAVRLADGRPVIVPCQASEGFKLRPDQLERVITPRTRWLVLNSPANPTGAVYSRRELAALAEVLVRQPQVWVLSDDIYAQLSYTTEPWCSLAAVAPALRDRILTVNGVSKAHAMTGWRIGYGAGPLELIRAMNTIQGHTTSHASSIAQYAAIEALAGNQDHVAGFREAFRHRRDLVAGRINRIPGLQCGTPDGAFYLFASCAGWLGQATPAGGVLESDADVAMFLLDVAGVAVVSGAAFSASPYLRLSFASAPETLLEACDRIEAASATLRSLAGGGA